MKHYLFIGLVNFFLFSSFSYDWIDINRITIIFVYLFFVIKSLSHKIKYLNFSFLDEDGDEISISSDVELETALLETKSDVKKLYVKVNHSNSDHFYTSENDNLNAWHPVIICDSCDNKVKGFRYKCLVCPDYDLCSSCEKTSLHSEHPMIRLSDAFAFVSVKRHFFKKFFRPIHSLIFFFVFDIFL